VVVTTTTGSRTLTDAFTYLDPPTILSVNPASGTITGNQTITITGAGFLEEHTTVSFGGSDAAVTVTSPTTLTATTPQHASGMVDVTVTTPVGTSVLSSGYEYLDPPVIEAFSPGQGVPGTMVVIVGRNFGTSPVVHIGGVPMHVVSATEFQLALTVPATAASGRITVETAGGTATTATSFVVLTYTGITVAPPTASLAIGETVQLSASGVFANGTTETLSDVQWTSSAPQIATVNQQGTVVAVAEGSATITATFASFAASATINVRSASPWPPDPSLIAPPVSATIFTPFASRVRFLYEGLNALQRDMTPGAIVPQRVCVIKGKVTTPAGEALPGVRISVHGSPNLGYAVSRADGMFDLVMNGGGDVTITYQADEYFPVQRTLTTAWEEFINAPTVAMTQADAQAATIIATGSQPVQVARASRVTDLAGSRQATLIFPAGVQSSMITSSGAQTLATLTVRATEYTVGSSGPAAMPGSLPAASGYTYAVELSADEAIAAGASEVRFTKPVVFYVENFLNFPVGGIVPVGYYERLRAAWVPSDNGRVIKITAINAATGLANIDFDGNGQADSDLALSAVGIGTDERRTLASIYTPGVSLWRMSTTHFSPWDCNWPYGLPLSAKAPGMSGTMDGRGAGDACTIPGSIIDCQNQSLGEVIPIAGTPYSLSYNSAKTPGFKAGRTVRIPVTGAQAPADVKRIELEIAVAGQFHKMVLAPLPNTVHEFEWSGLDAYGRKLIGVQDVKIRIGNTYDAVYQSPAANGQAFGRLSGIPLTGSRSRQEITLWQEQSAVVEAWPTTVSDAGGWFLTQHHLFDVSSGTLFLGSGGRVKSERLGNGVSTAGGVGCQNGGNDGDGGLATNARVDDPRIIATAPDGTIYFGSSDLHYIRKIKPDGTMATVARLGTDTRDGIPAASALVSPRQLAIGPDGALYFTDTNRVRRIRTDGIIETVAGSGAGTYSGDGGPALQAGFQDPWGIDVATDGTIFVTDNFRIRAIGTDGMIRFVGGSLSGTTGDGGPAASTYFPIAQPGTLKVGPDGSIYVAENGTLSMPSGLSWVARVRKISPSGIVSTIAGSWEGTPSGDGGFATDAILGTSITIEVAADGTIFIGRFDPGQRGIRKITTNGVVSTIVKAGGGCLGASGSLAVAPNGVLYVADTDNDLIQGVSYPGANYLTGVIAVPGANGELYVFDLAGRHLKTVDAVTGIAYATFSYDQKGKLASVTDINGRLTRLSRNASGALTAVIAPEGQETTVSLDGAGYLAAAIGPGNIAHRFSTESDGLLSSYTNPRGKTSTFEFDGEGRLAKDTDPGDGFKLVTRSDTVAQSISTIETAMGRKRQYITDYSDVGETRTTIDPSGLRNVTTRSSTGSLVRTSPDGTVEQTTFKPDPRFGIRAPLPEGTVKTPSGLTMSYAASTAVTLASSTDPLSVLTQTSTFKVNGKTWTSLLDTRTRKLVKTTPLGRQFTTFFDDKNRVTRIEQPATTPVEFEYANGLLVKASQGTRAAAFGYDEFERLDTITDPTLQTTRFEYDTADRVRKQTLPDLREIVFDYDENGNVTSIVPAGRPQHGFTFTATDQNEQYNPPRVSGGGFTRSTYNPDGQLTLITRADSTTIGFGYDAGGRIQSLSAPGASLTISYVPTTGHLASVTSTDGSSLTYAYDGSLVKSVTWGGAVTGAVSYNYDSFFRLASESVGTSSINYGYDDDGLLKSAGAMTITRHPASGRLTGTSLGAASDSYSYNLSGEISGYTAAYMGTPVLSFGYTRDANGRIATIGSRGYEYDASGRLVRVTNGGLPVAEYDYDANGNRIAHRYLGGSTTAIYDDQDRLLTYGDTTYEYTANGDLKAKTLVGATTTFDYDAFRNLRNVQIPGLRIDYMVDGQNRRIGKRVNGVLVKGWLYADQLRIVAELDGSGAVVSRFVYGSRSNVPDYVIKNGVTYRIISDHLGSPRLVVNVADGSVAQSMTHDEFGRVLSDSNPGFQPFGFAGGLYDRDTGLTRFGARDYDAHTGRWTTKDPIRFAGGDVNLYGYVWNDPINFIDPPGLWGFGISGAEATEVGFGTGVAGAGQQGAVGVGTFASITKLVEGDWANVQSFGGFASWGGIAYEGNNMASYPANCGGGILGGYAGLGANVWITNADDVSDLAGPFHTFSLNAAWGLKAFSLQVAWGKNAAGDTIGMLSYGLPGAGAGVGASISLYDTNTWTSDVWR
jgi:RHS repeat-associated protein